MGLELPSHWRMTCQNAPKYGIFNKKYEKFYGDGAYPPTHTLPVYPLPRPTPLGTCDTTPRPLPSWVRHWCIRFTGPFHSIFVHLYLACMHVMVRGRSVLGNVYIRCYIYSSKTYASVHTVSVKYCIYSSRFHVSIYTFLEFFSGLTTWCNGGDKIPLIPISSFQTYGHMQCVQSTPGLVMHGKTESQCQITDHIYKVQ